MNDDDDDDDDVHKVPLPVSSIKCLPTHSVCLCVEEGRVKNGWPLSG